MSMPRVTRFLLPALLLGGCNFPSAVVLSMAPGDGTAQLGDNLEVKFSPGLPLLQAAAEAPMAFSRLRGAASRIDLRQLSFGDASVVLEGEFLHKGMLLPLPAGMLTIRTIAPEATAVAVPVVPVAATTAEMTEDEPARRQLPEVIGAYSFGRRTLVLATDGSYLRYGPHESFEKGTFYLVGNKLELASQSGTTLAFAPTGSESWRDKSGTVYTLIHDLPLHDEHSDYDTRGGL